MPSFIIFISNYPVQLLWGPSSKKKKISIIWSVKLNTLVDLHLDKLSSRMLTWSGKSMFTPFRLFFFNSWQSRTIARSTTEKTTLAWVDCSCGRGHFSSLWLKEFVKYYEREFLMNCSGFLHLFWIAQAFCTILCFFFFFFKNLKKFKKK